MSLTQVTTPIQTVDGLKYNCFKGYVPTFFELLRADIEIDHITPQAVGGENFLKVQVVDFLDASQNMGVGDKIVLNTEKYPNVAGSILQIIIPNKQFIVDIPYIANDATGFMNYKKKWFAEYRIVKDDTTTDSQSAAANLFDFVFTTQSETTGVTEIDITVANNQNKPSVEVGLNNDMFVFFKVQWRELFLDNVGLWTSPTVDDPLIVFHASDLNAQENGIEFNYQNNIMLPDPSLTRFWNDTSPKINFLRSRLGDADPATTYRIRVLQFNIVKAQIQSQDIEIPNYNGVHTLDLSTITVDASTVFITFEAFFILDGGEYEEQEYKDDEYNVTTP